MSPVKPRTVVVHDRMEPPLVAGDYEVRARQTVGGAPTLGTVPDDVRHVRVTGPRYRLPPTEILSTFPPAGADGPFVTRLAQVALRRRTLPWERADGPSRPWMALVLLADGEGTYLPSVPVADAVTTGVRLTGHNPDGPTCAAIEVTQRVVREVFPSRQELALTCHVRQVPLDDTELAQGDEDGWVAVVLGTRLPRPRMRYRACLISLEGQWSALPDDPPVEEGIEKLKVYDKVSDRTIAAARRPRTDGVSLAVGSARAGAAGIAREHADVPERAGRETRLDREIVDHAVPPAGSGHTAPDAWGALSPGGPAGAGLTAATDTGYLTAGFGSVVLDVDLHVYDPGAPLLRFPVLASWEFRCDGDKDFAALVQELDVGMLGTVKPPASPAATAPEVSDTGHVVLDGADRNGDAARSWYRGPLVPRAVDRRSPQAVHVADQLRRVAEDGRLELGEAAAFELGRLLALSSPSAVAALREWRRLGFTRRRAVRLGEHSVLADLLGDWKVALGEDRAERIAQLMLTVVGTPAAAATTLPVRPAVDPLPELELFDDPARTVATGLAMPLRDVRQSFTGAVMPELTLERMAPISEVGFDALRRDATLVQPIRRELAGTIERLGGLLQGIAPPRDEEAPRDGEPGPAADTLEDLFGGGAE